MKRIITGASLILACLASAQKAQATIYNLPLPCRENDFRQLVSRAVSGDIIRIPSCSIQLTGPAGEELNRTGDLDIAHSITIQGTSPYESSISSADSTDRVIDILPETQDVPVVLTLRGVTISNGQTQGNDENGAGIRVGRGSRLILERSIVTKNMLSYHNNGGGIYVAPGAHLEMTRSNIMNNDTIYPQLLLEEGPNDAEDGWVGISGGGVYVDGGTAIIRKSSLIGNQVRNFGGGLAVLNRGSAQVEQTTIGENRAKFVDRDRLSDDEISGYGGGVFVGGHGSVTLTNVTIAHNQCFVPGCGVFNNGSSLQMRNTILINNLYFSETPRGELRGSYNCGANGGSTVSMGNNISGSDQEGYLLSEPTCSFFFNTALNDHSSTNALLQGLVNQGSISYYYPLTEGSPAIDRVVHDSCDFMDDQIDHNTVRIYPGEADRPSICDIGAYEYQNIPMCRM